MAFTINKFSPSGLPVPVIASAIEAMIAKSRFTAKVNVKAKSISIGPVRLRYKKDYCGNHPFPCPVRSVPRKHPINRCLEGADWVGFNDMLNDVLDALGSVCDCASSHVIIRKQGARCTNYTGHPLGNGIDNEWDKDSGAFENLMHVTGPKKASYPEGTPGFATYLEWSNYPENHSH